MTYMKPEMEIEKIDIAEEITGEASTPMGGKSVTGGDTAASAADATKNAAAASESIGSDLIIG